MRVLICGVDGYIGFPLAMRLLARGHIVYGLDNFLRRRMVREVGCISAIPILNMESKQYKSRTVYLKEFGDFNFKKIDIAQNYERLKKTFKSFKPESIVNLAQIPSAPYSMIDIKHANKVQRNNNEGLMNLLWLMKKYTPKCHITTLGTMGEYEQPNMPIPEGFFKVTYRGMSDVIEFPKLGGSFYHVSKTQSTKNMHYACRTWDIMGTDINQGIVYGTTTEEMGNPPRPELRTRFDFDECFGTMINRACACAIVGHPLIPYGSGMQTRAYIALRDSIRCLTLSVENPPNESDSIRCYRIINQFDESYSCNAVARRVQKIAKELGILTKIKHISNPRVEKEVHYYNPEHKKLYNMGWKPTHTLDQELRSMLNDLYQQFKKKKVKCPRNFRVCNNCGTCNYSTTILCQKCGQNPKKRRETFQDRIRKYRHKLNPTIKWR